MSADEKNGRVAEIVRESMAERAREPSPPPVEPERKQKPCADRRCRECWPTPPREDVDALVLDDAEIERCAEEALAQWPSESLGLLRVGIRKLLIDGIRAALRAAKEGR